MKIRHIANFLSRVLKSKRPTSSDTTKNHQNVCANLDQNVKKDIVVKLKDRKNSDDVYPLW